MRLVRLLLGVVALLTPTLLVAQNAPMTPGASDGLMAPGHVVGPMTPNKAGSGGPGPSCSNSLDFSQACNSQYLGAIL